MGRVFFVARVLAVLAPGVAAADYYYAVAVGEKAFRGREDRDYRAMRAAMGLCVREIDPALCELSRLERVKGRWEAWVVGRKGFYGADRDHQSRADRAALDACRLADEVRDCRLVAKKHSEVELEPEEPQQRPGVDDLLDDLFKPKR